MICALVNDSFRVLIVSLARVLPVMFRNDRFGLMVVLVRLISRLESLKLLLAE